MESNLRLFVFVLFFKLRTIGTQEMAGSFLVIGVCQRSVNPMLFWEMSAGRWWDWSWASARCFKKTLTCADAEVWGLGVEIVGQVRMWLVKTSPKNEIWSERESEAWWHKDLKEWHDRAIFLVVTVASSNLYVQRSSYYGFYWRMWLNQQNLLSQMKRNLVFSNWKKNFPRA